jgi:Protein of unknown function (DUF3574)
MRIGLIPALAFVLLTAAHTVLVAQTPSDCHAPQQAKELAELLFGRGTDASEFSWARFVARELTPRFPDGLTISDASGQWRNPANSMVVREPSKRVEIVLPGNADDQTRLDAVVTAYKRGFRQRSVVVIVHTACVSF